MTSQDSVCVLDFVSGRSKGSRFATQPCEELAQQLISKKRQAALDTRVLMERKPAVAWWEAELAKDAEKTQHIAKKATVNAANGLTFCTSDAMPCQYAEQLSPFRKPRKYLEKAPLLR